MVSGSGEALGSSPATGDDATSRGPGAMIPCTRPPAQATAVSPFDQPSTTRALRPSASVQSLTLAMPERPRASRPVTCTWLVGDGEINSLASTQYRDVIAKGPLATNSQQVAMVRTVGQRIQDARNLQRTDAFYEEARIPSRDRAALSDYRGSTYARGHLSAAADMNNDEAMAQSFSLANIIPQNQVNNAKAWVTIEKATRQYALRAKGNVYVITGPAYLRNHCPFVKEAKEALARAGIAAPPNPQAVVAVAGRLPGTRVPYRYDAVACTIGSGVAVPTHIFKLVYDASTNRAWAHWSENTSQTRVYPPISYAELVDLVGIDFLPGIKPQP